MKETFQSTIRFVLLLLIYTTLVISCKDNSTDIVGPMTNTIDKENEFYSVNGILGFSNHKSFLKFIEQNPLSDSKIRAKFEEKYQYTSMLSSYEKASKLDLKNQVEYAKEKHFVSFENSALQLNFGPRISNIANDEGLILIGQRLYQFLNGEVRNVAIKQISLLEGISALKGNSKFSSAVKTDSIKSIPINLKNQSADRNSRVGRGVYYTQGSTFLESPGREQTFTTFGKVNLYFLPISESYCDAGLVYDEDARDYVCAGPVVTTTLYVISDLACTIRGELKQIDRSGVWVNEETNASGETVQIQGNVTIYINGTAIPLSFNNITVGSNNTIWPYSTTTTTSPSNFEVEGSIIFTTKHNTYNSPYSSIAYSSASLAL